MTTEDLIRRKRSTSFAAGLLAGAIIISFIIMILQIINKGFTALIIIPIASLPILSIMYNQVKSMNQELKNRKLNE